MKKLILAFALLLSVVSFAQKKQTWKVDNYHSFLNFSIKHLGVSFVDGNFKSYEGTLEMDGEKIETGSFNFVVDANSINTGIEARDNHLKSADFFDTASFGKITFVSKSIKKITKNNYILIGDLTIKNVTKKVTFNLVYGGKAANDGYGNEKLGFQATTKINRFDFGVAYDPTGAAVGKEVNLQINLEFAKAK